MTETVLFVGGSADGMRRVYDQPRDNIDVQVMKGSATWVDSPERPPVIIERYRLCHIAPRIYLISTESPDNLIPLLIEGYRRKE